MGAVCSLKFRKGTLEKFLRSFFQKVTSQRPQAPVEAKLNFQKTIYFMGKIRYNKGSADWQDLYSIWKEGYIMIYSWLCSSQQKIFFDDTAPQREYSHASVMRNEPFSIQLAYRTDAETQFQLVSVRAEVLDKQAPIAAYEVKNVPVIHVTPAKPDVHNEARGPGLYPDMLVPRHAAPTVVKTKENKPHYYDAENRALLNASCDSTKSVWFTFNEDGAELEAGDYTLRLSVISLGNGEVQTSHDFTLTLIDALLPKSELIYTNWFHNDCLADIYDLELYSDEYFEVFEKFVRNAARHGMNTLLLPTFTPPLDTMVGEVRKNAQLVKVMLKNGHYEFDMSLLDRYITVSLDAGIELFEHTHMYSQWGATHAPAIYAEENGTERRIFGWDTKADSDEYREFLRAYMEAFLAYTQCRGIDDKIIYHVSDEPHAYCEESYASAANYFHSLVGDRPVMDALSHVEYYQKGLVRLPVASICYANDFAQANAPMLLYYTGGYYNSCKLENCTNRLITTKPYRTRILGAQLYRYHALGFLHWGYNYYYDLLSHGLSDPKVDPCCFKQKPGASYLVYPGEHREVYPSLREKLMCEAICDYRALMLLESLAGRESTEKLCDTFFGERMTDTTIPNSCEQMLSFREAINEEIAAHLK